MTTQQTFDPNITYHNTGCNGMKPCIKNHAGNEVSEYYLFKNYQRAVNLLFGSNALNAAQQEVIEQLQAEIEALKAQLVSYDHRGGWVGIAYDPEWLDLDNTQNDGSIYGQRM